MAHPRSRLYRGPVASEEGALGRSVTGLAAQTAQHEEHPSPGGAGTHGLVLASAAFSSIYSLTHSQRIIETSALLRCKPTFFLLYLPRNRGDCGGRRDAPEGPALELTVIDVMIEEGRAVIR
jgi:hypothetical protein